jgi:hypothetical protein
MLLWTLKFIHTVWRLSEHAVLTGNIPRILVEDSVIRRTFLLFDKSSGLRGNERAL